MKYSITAFVDNMTEEDNSKVWEDLTDAGLDAEDVDRGMGGRLCDLEDTIDIRKYI